MTTYEDYWRAVEQHYPHYYSAQIIADEEDWWKDYWQEKDPHKKEVILKEIKRLNHKIAEAVVDCLIDKYAKKTMRQVVIDIDDDDWGPDDIAAELREVANAVENDYWFGMTGSGNNWAIEEV